MLQENGLWRRYQYKNVDKDITTSLLEIYGEKQTIVHLFEVASGVQSMVVGENEILGQVKEAYDIAFSKHKTGPVLNKAFQSAIATGKRARAETAISRGAYSVSSIAIDAIRKTLLDYFEMTILIIGMGTMGTRCLKKLDALAHPNISIANRTYETADKLTNDHSVSVERYDDVFENLSQYNIIISCVSVKDKIIIPTHFNNTAKTKLIIDLGLPEMLTLILKIKNIQIINVDGLKEIATKNVGRRKDKVEKVNFIIESEYKKSDAMVYKSSKEYKWHRSLDWVHDHLN